MKTFVSIRGSGGQVLPLFALFLVVLFGSAALAIDVSSAYASQRAYREAADAASLAGGQDLQTTTRAITSANQRSARQHAYQILRDRLNASLPGADPTCVGNTSQSFDLNFRDCALLGTDFRFAIVTPALSCVTCDPTHSVQVTVRNPSFGLSFSRVLGFANWNVASTSVAGLTFQSKYAIVTLRPSDIRHNGTDANLDDINLAGTNTRVNVIHGDVGTNTYVVTNAASMLTLASGYFLDHVDDITPDLWNKDLSGNPVGRLIPPNIVDPAYPIPTARPPDPGPNTFDTQAAGLRGVLPLASCVDAPTGAGALPAGTECYKPGVYKRTFDIDGGGGMPGAYLEPGVYFFDDGVNVRSGASLWGGLQSGRHGVAIVVPQRNGGGYPGFDGTGANFLILNRGDVTCTDNGCRALPALDINGNEVKTSDGLLLTLMVPRDPACFTGLTPQLCADNQNNALKLAGNGTLIVAGVIYAPSDRVNINANFTAQDGVVGQIISWTVDYAGGALLNQDYPGPDGPGILRLDAACTVPGTPCNT